MDLYVVGARYPEWATGQQAIRMNYDNGVLTFFYGIPNARKNEVDAARYDDIVVNMAIIEGLIFFVIRLGENGWQDAPFEPILCDNEEFDFTYGQNEGAPLHICVVDTATGELKAMRVIGLSQSLSTAFMEQCRRRKEQMKGKPFNRAAYLSKIQELYVKYPTSEDMLAGSRPEWTTMIADLT